MSKANSRVNSSKVDGRKLRHDIRQFLKGSYPHANPHFTVRSIIKKRGYQKDEHILEVRFDELDPDLLVWSAVADWVLNVWWPDERGRVTMSKKVWSNRYLRAASTEVKVDRVEVGYGFTH